MKQDNEKTSKKYELHIAEVDFTMTKDTTVQFDPFSEISMDDLNNDTDVVRTGLRGKSLGLYLNFVSPYEYDFRSSDSVIPEGSYKEIITKKEGSVIGSIRNNVTTVINIMNPALKKLEMVTEHLEDFNISALTYGYLIPTNGNEIGDISKKVFQHIQEKYMILSSDEEGIRFEPSKDLYVSVTITDTLIKVKVETKYRFQFSEQLKKFNVAAFTMNLIDVYCDL